MICSLERLSPSLLSANAEKISDAPFPNARSVTPATDSEHENLLEIASKDGDKWWSAVSPNTYIVKKSRISLTKY